MAAGCSLGRVVGVSWDMDGPSADTCFTRGPGLAQPGWEPVCICTLVGGYVEWWRVGSQYGSWEVPSFWIR